MTRLVALAVAAVLVAPSAAALGVLPPDPPRREAEGLETARFRIPVRTEARNLAVRTPGNPVGAVGLAPPNGTPVTWHPLGGPSRLDVPPPNRSCWHGYCGVHHVAVKVLAPNVDGAATVPLVLAANGTRIRVPLELAVAPRRPHARPGPRTVSVETPVTRRVEDVHLRGPDRSWAARSGPDGFAVDRDRLPEGVPLTPVLTLPNGTRIPGPNVTLEARPAGGTDAANQTGPSPPRPDSSDPGTPGNQTPANGTGTDPTRLPKPPARAADGGRALPGPGGLALAAVAAAARATL